MKSHRGGETCLMPTCSLCVARTTSLSVAGKQVKRSGSVRRGRVGLNRLSGRSLFLGGTLPKRLPWTTRDRQVKSCGDEPRLQRGEVYRVRRGRGWKSWECGLSWEEGDSGSDTGVAISHLDIRPCCLRSPPLANLLGSWIDPRRYFASFQGLGDGSKRSPRNARIPRF